MGSSLLLATTDATLAIALLCCRCQSHFASLNQAWGVLCLFFFFIFPLLAAPVLMNTCWNSAFCRHAVFRLQISCGRGTPLRASRGTASHWDWGVLTAGTLLPPQLLSLLLLLRKAQLAAPCLIPVHLHPFPVPLLAAMFQEGVRYQSSSSMRCVSGYYFARCSQARARAWRWRLGFGCSIPGRDVPEAGGSGCPPCPRAREPKALISSLSHAREFLPLDGSTRAKKTLWETLRER